MKIISIVSEIFFMALDSMYLLPLVFIFLLNFHCLYEMPHLVKFLNVQIASSVWAKVDQPQPDSCGFILILHWVPLKSMCVPARIFLASNDE